MQDAAGRLRVSQPALTNHLQRLEKYFSQDIFAMNGRKKVLTTFGIKLKEVTKANLENLENDLKILTQKFESPESLHLKIAGRAEILNRIAISLTFPARLSFISADGAAAVEGLVVSRFDLAISSQLAKASELHARKFFADSFYLAAPKAWLNPRTQLSASLMQELSEKPYLSYKDSDQNLNILSNHYRTSRLPKIAKTLADWPSLLRMVNLQQGWTIAPGRYAVPAKNSYMIPVPTALIDQTQFYILYRKELSSMAWFKSFIKTIRV
jgi:DNA-binding transcriptional LysR family regulator